MPTKYRNRLRYAIKIFIYFYYLNSALKTLSETGKIYLEKSGKAEKSRLKSYCE